ncbi:glycosyltransferase family 2 protein [Lactobacillus corticis]|uniref:Glycosyl transferase n=1 Tax=Lactobacillus corticis TaxID=2201249 RepID=A0A916VHI3_9LACO|nr:glycosyltransferase family 2 protein [Lactobacillus corticis]GFZ27091.1 glycosyl transferase [Lactobacillus corticis]
MSKVLSLIVPCYNSAAYLERCVNSLVVGGEAVEIILVDDGSTDSTGKIIDSYAKKFPNLIKPLHEKNAGHGGAINNALKYATGTYLKVVDSDDWLDFRALQEVLEFLTQAKATGQLPDLLLCNYLYDKVGAKHKKLVNFTRLPKNQIFGWKQLKMHPGQYMMLHAVIFKTEVLRLSQVKLPEKVSYDDNILVYEPLKYVHSFYYLNIDLYHYFIGREDQSVNEQVMLRKIDQQLLINKRMIYFFAKEVDHQADYAPYLKYYLEIITTISSVILIRGKKREYLMKKRQLWNDLRRLDYPLYHSLRRRPFGQLINLPGWGGRKFVSAVYMLVHKLYGFN